MYMEIALGISLFISAVVLYRYVQVSQALAVERERTRRANGLEERLQELMTENSQLLAKVAELSAEVSHERQKYKNVKLELAEHFKSLSTDVLLMTQKNFFDVAKETFEKYSGAFSTTMQQKERAIAELVKPLAESLKAVDGKMHELEKSRVGAYAQVVEQLRTLAGAQGHLQLETAKLVRALRAPSCRGQWGEMQLRRVVEMAGMLSYCDFSEQQTIEDRGSRFRPDLIVRLPNNRSIVVDAKSPLQSYLEALDCNDEQVKAIKLKEHAKHLKKHLLELGEKAYWEKLSPTPEFVVLFLPGEAFFSTALEQDPMLIEYGVEKKVIIASPTTLISLLLSVAYGWKEERIAEHAKSIFDLAKSFHERLKVMVEHITRLKKSLDGSVDAYNKLVGSFETRVLPAARSFEALASLDADPIEDLSPVEKLTRSLEPVCD